MLKILPSLDMIKNQNNYSFTYKSESELLTKVLTKYSNELKPKFHTEYITRMVDVYLEDECGEK